ncbi:unnamed protein product [Arctogadus glacialis]
MIKDTSRGPSREPAGWARVLIGGGGGGPQTRGERLGGGQSSALPHTAGRPCTTKAEGRGALPGRTGWRAGVGHAVPPQPRANHTCAHTGSAFSRARQRSPGYSASEHLASSSLSSSSPSSPSYPCIGAQAQMVTVAQPGLPHKDSPFSLVKTSTNHSSFPGKRNAEEH